MPTTGKKQKKKRKEKEKIRSVQSACGLGKNSIPLKIHFKCPENMGENCQEDTTERKMISN